MEGKRDGGREEEREGGREGGREREGRNLHKNMCTYLNVSFYKPFNSLTATNRLTDAKWSSIY